MKYADELHLHKRLDEKIRFVQSYFEGFRLGYPDLNLGL